MSALKRILVVGGNGFIGSSVCRIALARGFNVTSISSSGKPFETSKGHTPSWTNKVDWHKGDALRPDTYAHLLEKVDGVVHTLGTLIEDSRYKNALKEGDFFPAANAIYNSFCGKGSNPLEVRGKSNYDLLNRDSAITVCETFLSSRPSSSINQNNEDSQDKEWSNPRPFVYISAEDIFRPIIPSRYIESKREAESSIENLIADQPDYRGVYIRPSLVYHAHHRPLTTPFAALLDFSASVHSKIPPIVPTPSGLLSLLGVQTGVSALQSMANALTIPPIHVDHVAEAICAALELPTVRGVVGVRMMRELIGWSDEGTYGSSYSASGTGRSLRGQSPER